VANVVTTVGSITFPLPNESHLDLVGRFAKEAEQAALVDFALHPVLFDPSLSVFGELPEFARRGHTSVRIS
jgi:hypothetical protein